MAFMIWAVISKMKPTKVRKKDATKQPATISTIPAAKDKPGILVDLRATILATPQMTSIVPNSSKPTQ